MAEEAQQLKKAAALAYDYDNDPRWAEYWSNVLIPHDRPKADVERHFKFKFYKQNIDPDLKLESLSSRPSTATSTSNSANQRTTSAGQGRPNTTSSSRPTPRGTTVQNGIKMDQHSVGFLLNALVVIMATIAVIPFTPQSISTRCYRFAFLVSIMACGQTIYVRRGRPRAWNMAALQSWLQYVVAEKDFLYLLYSIVFISTLMPIKFATIPAVCQSLISVGQYLQRNYSNTQTYRKYLQRPCRWLETNVTMIQTLSTNCEIGLGFLLVLFLLAPQKNFIQLLVYWQLLKLMYHAPSTTSFHRSAWSKIGLRANPLIRQYATFLETPLQFAKRWFHN